MVADREMSIHTREIMDEVLILVLMEDGCGRVTAKP